MNRATPSATLSSTSSEAPHLQAVVALPPLVSSLQTAATSVAATAAVVSIGSGASGANAGRISVLLKVASCSATPVSVQEPLPRSSHPLGFAVASAGASVQYDAGLVLGDIGIAAAVSALHFGITCARSCRGSALPAPTSGLMRAAAWARFPGLSTTVHLYLIPLVAQSAVACITRGTTFGIVIGVWALLVLACVLVALTYHTTKTLGRRMECGPSRGSGWLQPACEWRVRIADETSAEMHYATPEQLCACFGAYFEDYHYASRWWLTVELSIAIVSGFIGGLADTNASCLAVQVLGVFPNAAYLILLMWRRPFQRRLDFAVCSTVGTLVFASSVALCAGSVNVATNAALAASVVGFIPALCTPYKLAQQLRTIRRLKHQRREKEKRHAQRALLTDTTASPAEAPNITLSEPAAPVPSAAQEEQVTSWFSRVDTRVALDDVADQAEARQGTIGFLLLDLDTQGTSFGAVGPDADLDELLLGSAEARQQGLI